jgi:hypothetical protein
VSGLFQRFGEMLCTASSQVGLLSITRCYDGAAMTTTGYALGVFIAVLAAWALTRTARLT